MATDPAFLLPEISRFSMPLPGIERENAGLLKRITQQKSTINTRKMNDEHAEQQKIMKMRCEIARFNAGKQGMSKIVEDREGICGFLGL